ncbi:MAG: energy-coupling factor transporter transmembrane component T, partial [Alistipes sp.]|nr:energy-coupling factor transporter transmembrane component T [Alistipes sp.]
SVLSTQLLFVYRYLFVLLQEALSMTRARDARSFGRRSYPLRVWGVMIGQLLIRTFERAERIHRAMLSRGFDGRIRSLTIPPPWQRRDTLFLSVWGAVFVVLRFLHPIEGLTSWWN